MKEIMCFIGLPGSGKTTLANFYGERVNGCRINADYVRQHINRDLGFTDADRIEQARRMAHLANMVLNTGANNHAVVDFVCPTPETREAFLSTCIHPVKIIWMNTIPRENSRFADTSNIWIEPHEITLHYTVNNYYSLANLQVMAHLI